MLAPRACSRHCIRRLASWTAATPSVRLPVAFGADRRPTRARRVPCVR